MGERSSEKRLLWLFEPPRSPSVGMTVAPCNLDAMGIEKDGSLWRSAILSRGYRELILRSASLDLDDLAAFHLHLSIPSMRGRVMRSRDILRPICLGHSQSRSIDGYLFASSHGFFESLLAFEVGVGIHAIDSDLLVNGCPRLLASGHGEDHGRAASQETDDSPTNDLALLGAAHDITSAMALTLKSAHCRFPKAKPSEKRLDSLAPPSA